MTDDATRRGLRHDRDELRLGLSLSGGVSLAVWIGGTTHEVNELRTGRGAWDEALDLLRTTVTVDVVSGTSAGGINGAVLALAIARETSSEQMRRLWVDGGGLEQLLRAPTERGAPSLLRGDDYLLTMLRDVFGQLAAAPVPAGADRPDLDLTLTGTLLRGVQHRLPDDFGALVADVDNHARFHFRRTASEGVDDFVRPHLADELARAARSTAAFPGAFEASFVQVGPAAPGELMSARSAGQPPGPDMRDVVNFPSSRWVVDGGLLANQPLGDTLRAVYRQRADRQVRRAVLLVSPDPAAVAADVPDEAGRAPSLGTVLLGSVNAPRVQSLAADLAGYREHNRSIRKLHDSRDAAVRALSTARALATASELFDVYEQARRRSSARYVRERFVALVGAAVPGVEELDWEQDVLYRLVVERENLPWLPSGPPAAVASVQDVAPWGLFPLERSAGVLVNLLTRALHAAGTADDAAALSGLLARCFDDVLRPARAARSRGAHSQRDAVDAADRTALDDAEDLGAAVRGWAREVVAGWIDRPDPAGVAAVVDLARALGRLAVDAGAVLGGSTGVPGAWVPADEEETLVAWSRWLATDDPVEALRRLLVFEVLETSFGSNEIEIDQMVRVVQLSGDTPCPAVAGPLPVTEKINGVQLGHFGAFLKRSWRANDWMWGRLDATATLSRVVLDPRRLRQLYPPSEPGRLHPALQDGSEDAELGRLADLVLGRGSDRAHLLANLDRAALVAETGFLRDPAAPTPASLPRLAAALARRRDVEVLREELPHVRDAVAHDESQGAARSHAGRDLLRGYAAATVDGPLSAADAERLLRDCGIGREKAVDEIGTPTMTDAAVSAFASGANVLDGALGANPFVGRPLGVVRRTALAGYWLQRSSRDRSPVTQWVRAGLLASALTVVVLGLVVTGVPGWVEAGAWVVLLGGGLLLLAARPRPALLVAVLLAAAGAGVLTWDALRAPVDLSHRAVAAGGAVAALTAALLLRASRWSAERDGRALAAAVRRRVRQRRGSRPATDDRASAAR